MKSCLYFSLVSSVMFCGLAYGACTPSPDCASLGYTATSCPNGGVKCPFDTTKWHCDKSCEDFGFKYSCTGTGYTGGAGTSCNSKFTSCNCASGYEWMNGVCVCDSAYQYSCTGIGCIGGAGTACNGKYASCKCFSGYNWKGGVCRQPTVSREYCCNDGSVSCGYSPNGYNHCKSNFGYDDCSTIKSRCRLSDGTASLISCPSDYYDNDDDIAQLECRI